MRRSRTSATAALTAGLLLAVGCLRSLDDAPDEVVRGLYQILQDSAVTGAPSPGALAAMAPFVTRELLDLLAAAAALRDAEAAANPGDKPPYVEGDLFSSLFEGPTGLTIPARRPAAPDSLLVLEFRDTRETPAIVWTDTVLLRREDGRLVVADIRYGATWEFANRGSLVEALRAVGPAGSGTHPWTVRFDGAGPVTLGMLADDAERFLGGPVAFQRIEPGESCGYAVFPGTPSGVAFMVEGDTLVRVDVERAGLLTQEGVGVGTAEADVVARFGNRLRVEPHPYEGPEGHYLIVDAPDGRHRMIFETDGLRVTRYRAGRLPEADYIEGCA